jgi:hypothetical protein
MNVCFKKKLYEYLAYVHIRVCRYTGRQWLFQAVTIPAGGRDHKAVLAGHEALRDGAGRQVPRQCLAGARTSKVGVLWCPRRIILRWWRSNCLVIPAPNCLAAAGLSYDSSPDCLASKMHGSGYTTCVGLRLKNMYACDPASLSPYVRQSMFGGTGTTL